MSPRFESYQNSGRYQQVSVPFEEDWHGVKSAETGQGWNRDTLTDIYYVWGTLTAVHHWTEWVPDTAAIAELEALIVSWEAKGWNQAAADLLSDRDDSKGRCGFIEKEEDRSEPLIIHDPIFLGTRIMQGPLKNTGTILGRDVVWNGLTAAQKTSHMRRALNSWQKSLRQTYGPN